MLTISISCPQHEYLGHIQKSHRTKYYVQLVLFIQFTNLNAQSCMLHCMIHIAWCMTGPAHTVFNAHIRRKRVTNDIFYILLDQGHGIMSHKRHLDLAQPQKQVISKLEGLYKIFVRWLRHCVIERMEVGAGCRNCNLAWKLRANRWKDSMIYNPDLFLFDLTCAVQDLQYRPKLIGLFFKPLLWLNLFMPVVIRKPNLNWI